MVLTTNIDHLRDYENWIFTEYISVTIFHSILREKISFKVIVEKYF